MPTRTPARPADAREGVFRALADATRREVVERLGRGPASVSELAGGFDMALPSFVEHLRVLEASGVVRSEKRGRVRTYALAPGGLRPLEDWLSAQRRLWERRLDQFDEYVRQLHVAEQEGTTPMQPTKGRTGGSR
ncbi:MAG: ArsR/SmtB family transcription factor [Dehalococcoidia bacterium]